MLVWCLGCMTEDLMAALFPLYRCRMSLGGDGLIVGVVAESVVVVVSLVVAVSVVVSVVVVEGSF